MERLSGRLSKLHGSLVGLKLNHRRCGSEGLEADELTRNVPTWSMRKIFLPDRRPLKNRNQTTVYCGNYK